MYKLLAVLLLTVSAFAQGPKISGCLPGNKVVEVSDYLMRHNARGRFLVFYQTSDPEAKACSYQIVDAMASAGLVSASPKGSEFSFDILNNGINIGGKGLADKLFKALRSANVPVVRARSNGGPESDFSVYVYVGSLK